MKPLAFNLKNAKKIGGDQHSSTFALGNGHHLTVAHHAVSPLQRKQLETMPVHKFDDGGQVAQDPGPPIDQDKAAQFMKAMKAAQPKPKPAASVAQMARGGSVKHYADGTDDGPVSSQAEDDLSDLPVGTAPPEPSVAEKFGSDVSGALKSSVAGFKGLLNPIGEAASQFATGFIGSPADASVSPEDGSRLSQAQIDSNAAPGSAQSSLPAAQQPAPSSLPFQAGGFEEAYQKAQQAIGEQQGAAVQAAKNQAAEAQQNIKDTQALQTGFQNNSDLFQQHQQNVLSDYMSGHIDPKAYVENMDTEQKVRTGIGLILGGFAAGVNGGTNPVLAQLNKQIDRDISAQQSRQEQQKTLFGANRQLYGDSALAYNATKANMLDIRAQQAQEDAAKNGTASAKANADALSGQLGMQSAALRQQNAMRATALQAVQSGVGRPEQLIPMLIQNPEAQKEALKEAGQAQAAASNYKFLMDQFDKAASENSLIGAASRAGRTGPATLAMNALELPMIRDQEGRVNEFEQKTVQALHPAIGDLASRVAQKRPAYSDFILNKMQTPTLNAYAPALAARFRAPIDQAQQQRNPREGQTGTLPSGQKVIMQNGKLVPYAG